MGREVWSFQAYGFLCRLVLAVVKLLQEGPLSPDRSKVSLFLYPKSHHVLVSFPPVGLLWNTTACGGGISDRVAKDGSRFCALCPYKQRM